MENTPVASEKRKGKMGDKENPQPGDDCEDDVCPVVGLGDLPEVCLAVILSCLRPREVARLACVCRSLRAASTYDSVWDRFLPPKYTEYLDLGADPSRFASKREIFDHLCHPLMLANHTKACWLDRNTGGVCMSMAARGLHIIWSEDNRYWEWGESDENSIFPEVARLKDVCWFEARGEMECSLLPGAYTFTWRLRLVALCGWEAEPVHFTLSKNDVDVHECKSYIDTRQRRGLAIWPVEQFELPTVRSLDAGWTEYDVGDFVVEKGEETCTLKFSMTAVHVLLWKSGLFLDGVVIRPTHTIRQIQQSTQVSTGSRTRVSTRRSRDTTFRTRVWRP